MSRTRATLIGFIAIALWSALIGLTRIVMQSTNPAFGTALMYSLSTLVLYFTVGLPKLSEFPRRYLYFGSVLFAATGILFNLSVAHAHTARQTVEVGMVNYMWPSLIVICSVVFNRQKVSLLIIPGLILAILGISLVLSGEEGIDLNSLIRNIMNNPQSYGMAFTGALSWAIYSTITSRMANGKNGITLFFFITTLISWGNCLIADIQSFSIGSTGIIFLVLATVSASFGYATWNIGMLFGNVTVLATVSYFIPVFSSLFSSTLLKTPLGFSFWQGTALVCIGSLMCWISIKKQTPGVHEPH